MTTELKKHKKFFRTLHKDERGLNTVEIVIILFVAVLILVVLMKFFWTEVYDKMTASIKELLGMRK